MQANLNWLTDPELFRVNRLDAHSDHICYASKEELDRGESSLYQSLDGCWKLAWSRNPGCRPEDFWQEGYDDSSFGSIQVPAHMELQGYGQNPVHQHPVSMGWPFGYPPAGNRLGTHQRG